MLEINNETFPTSYPGFDWFSRIDIHQNIREHLLSEHHQTLRAMGGENNEAHAASIHFERLTGGRGIFFSARVRGANLDGQRLMFTCFEEEGKLCLLCYGLVELHRYDRDAHFNGRASIEEIIFSHQAQAKLIEAVDKVDYSAHKIQFGTRTAILTENQVEVANILPPCMFTGPGGSGKSLLLRYINGHDSLYPRLYILPPSMENDSDLVLNPYFTALTYRNFCYARMPELLTEMQEITEKESIAWIEEHKKRYAGLGQCAASSIYDEFWAVCGFDEDPDAYIANVTRLPTLYPDNRPLREEILRLYQGFSAWMAENNHYNMHFFHLPAPDAEHKSGVFLSIDECQIYSPVQLKNMLQEAACENGALQAFVAGDPLQSGNAIQNERFIIDIFSKSSFKPLIRANLKRSMRCPQQVVRVLNCFNQIRSLNTEVAGKRRKADIDEDNQRPGPVVWCSNQEETNFTRYYSYAQDPRTIVVTWQQYAAEARNALGEAATLIVFDLNMPEQIQQKLLGLEFAHVIAWRIFEIDIFRNIRLESGQNVAKKKKQTQSRDAVWALIYILLSRALDALLLYQPDTHYLVPLLQKLQRATPANEEFAELQYLDEQNRITYALEAAHKLLQGGLHAEALKVLQVHRVPQENITRLLDEFRIEFTAVVVGQEEEKAQNLPDMDSSVVSESGTLTLEALNPADLERVFNLTVNVYSDSEQNLINKLQELVRKDRSEAWKVIFAQNFIGKIVKMKNNGIALLIALIKKVFLPLPWFVTDINQIGQVNFDTIRQLEDDKDFVHLFYLMQNMPFVVKGSFSLLGANFFVHKNLIPTYKFTRYIDALHDRDAQNKREPFLLSFIKDGFASGLSKENVLIACEKMLLAMDLPQVHNDRHMLAVVLVEKLSNPYGKGKYTRAYFSMLESLIYIKHGAEFLESILYETFSSTLEARKNIVTSWQNKGSFESLVIGFLATNAGASVLFNLIRGLPQKMLVSPALFSRIVTMPCDIGGNQLAVPVKTSVLNHIMQCIAETSIVDDNYFKVLDMLVNMTDLINDETLAKAITRVTNIGRTYVQFSMLYGYYSISKERRMDQKAIFYSFENWLTMMINRDMFANIPATKWFEQLPYAEAVPFALFVHCQVHGLFAEEYRPFDWRKLCLPVIKVAIDNYNANPDEKASEALCSLFEMTEVCQFLADELAGNSKFSEEYFAPEVISRGLLLEVQKALQNSSSPLSLVKKHSIFYDLLLGGKDRLSYMDFLMTGGNKRAQELLYQKERLTRIILDMNPRLKEELLQDSAYFVKITEKFPEYAAMPLNFWQKLRHAITQVSSIIGWCLPLSMVGAPLALLNTFLGYLVLRLFDGFVSSNLINLAVDSALGGVLAMFAFVMVARLLNVDFDERSKVIEGWIVMSAAIGHIARYRTIPDNFNPILVNMVGGILKYTLISIGSKLSPQTLEQVKISAAEAGQIGENMLMN